MDFKNLCVLVLRAKVASTLEGLNGVFQVIVCPKDRLDRSLPSPGIRGYMVLQCYIVCYCSYSMPVC